MQIPNYKVLFDFSGKTALVTGADKGIGRGIALRFAEAGADCAVTFRSNKEGALSLCGEIEEKGGRGFAVQCDQQDEGNVISAVSEVIKYFGGIDVLINNAGIYPAESLLKIDEKEWDSVMNTNVKGIHFFTRAVSAEAERTGKECSIVNIASIEGENPAVNHAHYAASKGGVIMYTKACALELAPLGIRVNSVSPGLIWCPGIEESWPDGVNRYLASVPIKRLGMPEDAADACLFLASSAARWITGINLRVDGGLSAVPGY